MLSIKRLLRLGLGALAVAGALTTSAAAQDVQRGQQSGLIQWGIWIDPDGCMHWMADGGLEQYQVNRLNPETGRPVCVKMDTCYVGNTDTMFHTDSYQLTAATRQRLQQVFSQSGVSGYAVYGHTDSRASHAYNQTLSENRARAVADVGRSVGAVIEREMGFGETRPVASNANAAGMAKNRRVEVICYRW
ncbi:OmpA family protein [Thalassorhabdomicrobium marinisediminis]|uniref:OmpA family protein n=1 Tax=Thalassorhabdomicrobium marinisediminis TaxID=2170577 RepID=A0A2T7FSZ6_9RHOB|nr:OmpA family protein [Thalassorhabdomicrobium marinisediminis]PVA05301.1 OmpA family protein [Thalassorhabdomicrobium marinisediminis]